MKNSTKSRSRKRGMSRPAFINLVTNARPLPSHHRGGITHRVFGDALRGLGIHHSDRLYCEAASHVESDQLALVDTPYGLLPRFVTFAPEGFVKLEAANANTPTLCLHPNEVQIIGRVVTLLRDVRGVRREGRAA